MATGLVNTCAAAVTLSLVAPLNGRATAELSWSWPIRLDQSRDSPQTVQLAMASTSDELQSQMSFGSPLEGWMVLMEAAPSPVIGQWSV
eukprot:CAMPEP_0185776192 /NCGR_PEP_ID=MMETSP1174-20130828/84838_1 /TAXON_ID=35687 /ORGANISM="Dictyocha speculum, Strain CCMP1381" /LENGTH=88 /DNA_ID=CAMNT_0028464041 /DNA_START=99 /DNA_END=363 /DNA_ORIENTATION=+